MHASPLLAQWQLCNCGGKLAEEGRQSVVLGRMQSTGPPTPALGVLHTSLRALPAACTCPSVGSPRACEWLWVVLLLLLLPLAALPSLAPALLLLLPASASPAPLPAHQPAVPSLAPAQTLMPSSASSNASGTQAGVDRHTSRCQRLAITPPLAPASLPLLLLLLPPRPPPLALTPSASPGSSGCRPGALPEAKGSARLACAHSVRGARPCHASSRAWWAARWRCSLSAWRHSSASCHGEGEGVSNRTEEKQ